ncbi:MAG: TolC family protein [Salaquimonas sp.]
MTELSSKAIRMSNDATKDCYNMSNAPKNKIQQMARGLVPLLGASLLLGGCMVTPQPLSESELALTAETNLARVTQNQEPISRSVSLYEAMARSLKYNLDHKVEMMARDVADAKLNVARSEMLPSLVANSHYSDRNNKPHSYSESLTGIRSANPSTSRNQESFTKDITFSWNILDFGLSYVRAKQAADQAMIAEEQKRKVVIRIMEDVRTAYWRAVSADRLLSGFQALEGRVEHALKNSRSLGNSGYTSPVAALTYQRELVDIKKQIQRLERELKTSKIQLAALMNIPPNEQYSLVIPKRQLSSLNIKIPSSEMTRLALQNRPEIREIAYKSRISEKEAEAALLELLPGIQLYAGANYDTNDFLLNSDWVSWGAKASWNLMKLFQYPAKKQLVNADQGLNDQRNLAMTMAIMTQVEVARARYHYLRKSAQTAQQYHEIQSKILKQVRGSASSGAASEQSLIREEMNALVASAEYDIAYSDLQNAFATIYASIGVNPWGDYLDTNTDVGTLTSSLKQVWQERGDHGG